MIGRAYCEIEDNGRTFKVELPEQQALLDRLYECQRDADMEIKRLRLMIGRYLIGMWAAIMLSAALIAALLVVVI